MHLFRVQGFQIGRLGRNLLDAQVFAQGQAGMHCLTAGVKGLTKQVQKQHLLEEAQKTNLNR